MSIVKEERDVIGKSYERGVSETSLGFAPFDLEAHYRSHPTSPDSEKSVFEHIPEVKPKESKHSVSRKSLNKAHATKKELRKVAHKIEHLREKQRKAERKTTEAERKYNDLLDKLNNETSQEVSSGDGRSHNENVFMQRLHCMQL